MCGLAAGSCLVPDAIARAIRDTCVLSERPYLVLPRNPYATDAPKIVAQDGTYLGKLSDNPYDPDSVANPYGRYGSPYSPTSIKNPYSTYGSPYSPQSPNNPYATQAPLLFGE